MLKHLYVKNFILIDEADLDFPGFSKMAGVKKTDKYAKSKAVAILDDKLKK